MSEALNRLVTAEKALVRRGWHVGSGWLMDPEHPGDETAPGVVWTANAWKEGSDVTVRGKSRHGAVEALADKLIPGWREEPLPPPPPSPWRTRKDALRLAAEALKPFADDFQSAGDMMDEPVRSQYAEAYFAYHAAKAALEEGS